MDKTQKKPRINGAMMPHFNNNLVCLLGKVGNVDSNGMAFHLITSDNQRITVRLNEPLREHLGDLVEVYGVVRQGEIVCSSFTVLHHQGSQPFDMALYDKTVRMTQKYKEHYATTH